MSNDGAESSGTRGFVPQQQRQNNNCSPYDLTTDESFVDERFGGSSSWEGRSFDSEEQQRKQREKQSHQQHDRRKRFDTTTPTLIDEEEEEEEEEEEDETEIMHLNTNSFEQQQQVHREGETMRRTPGATMYKSAFSEDHNSNSSNMRRTPGASAMYRIDTTSSNGSISDQPLGFGLTLSTPVTTNEEPSAGETRNSQQQQQQQQWGHSHDSSPQSEETEKVKPEPRGPFSFAPWAQQGSTRTPEDAAAAAQRGSFYPHILRLTEDIGNFLHVDEDDDYTLPPAGFHSAKGSWSNPFKSNALQLQRPAVPVRKSPNPLSINAPKPRRNEMLGGFGRNDDNKEKTRLVLGGGAFAPPPADLFARRPEPNPGDLNTQASHSFEWPLVAPKDPAGASSEMHATASVFVPRSTTPLQYPASSGEAWQQHGLPYGVHPPPHVWQQPQPQLPIVAHTTEATPIDIQPQQPKGNKRETTPRRKQPQQQQQIKSKINTKKRGSGKKKHDADETPVVSSSDDHSGVLRKTSDDPSGLLRRQQGELVLMESPQTRAAFKEFYRAFRGKERLSSFQEAEQFALKVLEDETFPESVHWKVYLELADLAKRYNRYVEARCLYQKVCQLQPYASQGWLEFSKLEEECGNMNRVSNILHNGLTYCDQSENLLTRAVKHQEKMGNIANARALLAKLKNVGVEKVWRTVLEGALLELRAGRVPTARRVLRYLMHHVPWYGPLYLEAYRLEKDQGHTAHAMRIVERGLRAIPRYGPLWFGAFRLCEEIDMSKRLYHLPSCMSMVERATACISKELVWKVHLEASQMLERAALEQADVNDPSYATLIYPARRRVGTTVLTCPNNLRWKVWLTAARVELGSGNTERARSLFLRAHAVVPLKGRSSTLIEFARLEEFVGDTELARAILCKGRSCYGHDWKVWLESVLLEIRCRQFMRAIEICNRALEIHHGTGRLWATLVQLRQVDGQDKAQHLALCRALSAVPKSGEVWCEGGRMHLNPFSNTFSLVRARRHLEFATRFTPQYGDGFVETIRLELVDQWMRHIADFIWGATSASFGWDSNSASLDDHLVKYIVDVTRVISMASATQQHGATESLSSEQAFLITEVRSRLSPEEQLSVIDLNSVRLACVNADPNYGMLWFHCRQRMTDTPRRIIEDAATIIAQELRTHAHFYLAAMLRRRAILSTLAADDAATLDDVQLEKWVNDKLHAAPSLSEIFKLVDPATGTVVFEGPFNGSLFATAVTELNRQTPVDRMSLSERKRVLFGNDALFP